MSITSDCPSLGTLEASLCADVVSGLSKPQKSIPAKYFYDERGSRLFDEITGLAEYYPTRTEEGIMRQYISQMIDLIGQNSLLVELGSGSSTKTRILLDRLSDLSAYVPIDISGDFLKTTAASLRKRYPELTIQPVAKDYTQDLSLPAIDVDYDRIVTYFPGSTIGNLDPSDASEFMMRIREMVGEGGGLLIGVDLVKDVKLLEAAYNDTKGITASFNLNLLTRINRELGTDFNEQAFQHRAVFNTELSRIEMHLISKIDQSVHLGDREFKFSQGEYIYTESSYKYTIDGFASLAQSVGFQKTRTWTDEDALFSIHYLDSNF